MLNAEGAVTDRVIERKLSTATAPGAGSVPTGVAAVEQAIAGVLPMIRQRADDVERDRRLPEELVVAIRGTGANRMLLPTSLGGLEAPVSDVIEVVEQIAAMDGSVAWCTAIGLGSNYVAGYLPEAAARTVFEDPDQGSATVFAAGGTIVGDANRRVLTGRWPFASNCLHSVWIGLGTRVDSGDGGFEPLPRMVFVPVDDLTVEDTWDVLGLRGTGSHHVSVQDLAIDLDRSCTITDLPWADGPLWRLPIYTALVPVLTAVALGIARGALDEIARQVREGRDARRTPLAEDPISLARYAEVDSRLTAARAALFEVVREAHTRAERGDIVDQRLQARTLLACHLVSDAAAEVTSTAHELSGGDSVYNHSRLQRALRDIQTSRQHFLYARSHRAPLAKALARVDIDYPPFIIESSPPAA